MSRPDDLLPEMEGAVSDAALFALLAQYMADAVFGSNREGPYVRVMPWEADLAIFAAHQAKHAAERTEILWEQLMERRKA